MQVKAGCAAIFTAHIAHTRATDCCGAARLVLLVLLLQQQTGVGRKRAVRHVARVGAWSVCLLIKLPASRCCRGGVGVGIARLAVPPPCAGPQNHCWCQARPAGFNQAAWQTAATGSLLYGPCCLAQRCAAWPDPRRRSKTAHTVKPKTEVALESRKRDRGVNAAGAGLQTARKQARCKQGASRPLVTQRAATTCRKMLVNAPCQPLAAHAKLRHSSDGTPALAISAGAASCIALSHCRSHRRTTLRIALLMLAVSMCVRTGWLAGVPSCPSLFFVCGGDKKET